MSCMQMVQRPQWRRRATDAGVLVPLVELISPDILNVRVVSGDSRNQKLIAYNMLIQVLMTINWCGLYLWHLLTPGPFLA